MKVSLPDVTLVCLETREHELARLAIEDCDKVADFGEILLFTDKPAYFRGFDAEIHYCEDWPEKIGWSRAWWFDVPPRLKTSHTLNIQWDSWICDASMWRDEFLDYDYIGAPWWYEDAKNVGNGGFSLVSTRLKRYIYDRKDKFPCTTAVDDDLLCRTYRADLEDAGFTWAPEHIAHDFAFECCKPSPEAKHFGFHGLFNWPKVLDKERFLDRMAVAKRSPYISDPNKHFMKALHQFNPGLADILTGDK